MPYELYGKRSHKMMQTKNTRVVSGGRRGGGVLTGAKKGSGSHSGERRGCGVLSGARGKATAVTYTRAGTERKLAGLDHVSTNYYTVPSA